ncbi:hypothetical protein KAR91_19450 [Candidatus Pacearchaeota archaeon]|nr:hypothetical protein [Candidatus Pacearchaeota archaeon]
MRKSLLLSLFLIVSVLFITGCSVTSQADAAGKDIETQPIQTTATPPTTTTQTTEVQTTTTTQNTTAPITTATNNKPATFSVSDLTIEPREVATAELFTISVTVTNTGGSQGSYDAILYIEEMNAGDPENVIMIPVRTITKSVIIAAGESKKVTFDSLGLEDGIYFATIDELVDYFEVGC